MTRISYASISLILFFSLLSMSSFAQPPDTLVRGRLVFLGKTNDLSQSVWLSVTTAGSFNLEAQGQQLIDTWSMSRRGVHLSLSPIVSQGNGGTHFLINRINDRILDSQNQKGGIIFPPLPSEPPSVMPPIVVIPGHPIVNPPVTPPSGTIPGQNPIIIPPGTPPNVTDPSSGYPSGMLSNGSKTTPTNYRQTRMKSNDTQSSNQQTKSKKCRTSASINKTQTLSNLNQQAPITAGRQFDQAKEWNVWSDNYFFDTKDSRHDLDANGTTMDFAMGADRRVATHLVLGGLVAFVKYNYAAFDGDLKNQATGFNLGPYFGYSILPTWSLNGSLTYGQLQNNNQIASLTSAYRTQVLHTDLRATGSYQFCNFQLRPKPLISFTHFRNPAYPFKGIFGNTTFQITRPQESYNFNFAEFRIEGNYTFVTKSGNIIQPYVEPGIDYAFARPNDGQMLTGNLNLASTAPVVETLTAGVRTFFCKSLLIDSSASYLSFGQHGLDVWELRLLASYSFG